MRNNPVARAHQRPHLYLSIEITGCFTKMWIRLSFILTCKVRVDVCKIASAHDGTVPLQRMTHGMIGIKNKKSYSFLFFFFNQIHECVLSE